MAYITPSSQVMLLHNVPFDSRYQDTIKFESASEQETYFKDKSIASSFGTGYQTITFQRKGSNSIRVQLNEAYLADCNYLMFRNPRAASLTDGKAYATAGSTYNKWYYCFVTDVRYINENTSEITYQIDVLQTYMFDWILNRCMIERETVSDDTIGSHTLPEDIDVGEQLYVTYGTIFSGLTDLCIVIVTSRGEFDRRDDGVVRWVSTSTGSYSLLKNTFLTGGGCVFPLTEGGAKNATLVINQIISGSAEDGAMIYLAPYFLGKKACGISTESELGDNGAILSTGDLTIDDKSEVQLTETTTLYNNYAPNNKKLLTYPYNFFEVVSPNGGSLTLRYEYFKNHTPTFKLDSVITQPVTLTLRPVGYGGTGSGTRDSSKSLTLSGYPLCQWSASGFQQWIANTVPQQLVQALGSAAIGIATSGASESVGISEALSNVGRSPTVFEDINRLEGVMNQYSDYKGIQHAAQTQGLIDVQKSAVSLLGSGISAARSATVCSGNGGTGNGLAVTGYMTFFGGQMSCKKEVAEEIDDYFTMFGYKVMRVHTPHVDQSSSKRTYFYYCKTKGSCVTGSIPSSDRSVINAIFDKGIRFWYYDSANSTSYIYRYDLGNPINSNL